MISSAICDKTAQVNFQRLTKLHEHLQRLQFDLCNLRVVIYPKSHEKNHVITC